MAQTASKEALSVLHQLICERLTDILRNGTPVFNPEGEEVGREPASAAIISAAIKFLKDNDIAAVLTPGSPLEGVVKGLPVFEDEDGYTVN